MTRAPDSPSSKSILESPEGDDASDPKIANRYWFSLNNTREEWFFLLLAVFIGVFSALAVVCFRLAIDWTKIWLLGPVPEPYSWRLIAAPAVTSLVVAFLVIHVFPLVRGSGVNQTKAALYIYNGYIPFRTAVGKFITAALAIGSGQSLGPEDPALQIGASLASVLGRRLDLSRERLRLLAPVGAAAGLAAAFNAPISAVLFVIEEVIGRWSAGILGSVVLSAVSSVVVVRWFLGAEPLFRIPAVGLVQPAELLAYATLGIVGAFAAVVFAKAIAYLRPRLRAWPRWTRYFQPATGRCSDRLDRISGRSPGDGGGLRIHRPGHARPVHLEDVGSSGCFENCRYYFVIRHWHAGWNVRSHPFYRGHVGRRDRWFGTPLLSGVDRVHRHLRIGRHGGTIRGIPPRAHDIGFHGARSQWQLFHHRARDCGQYVGVRHFPGFADYADFRPSHSPGWPRLAIARRTTGPGSAARRRCDEGRSYSNIERRRPGGPGVTTHTRFARRLFSAIEPEWLEKRDCRDTETSRRRRQRRNDLRLGAGYSASTLPPSRSHT